MSDMMRPILFARLIDWIFREYKQASSIFGIPSYKFYRKQNSTSLEIFGKQVDSPLGPAAGPHTQLAQNIISAYLTGGRFFELKTVQKLDDIEVEKPCIDANEEGYNTEWSTELQVEQAYKEYVKAWFIIHLLHNYLSLSNSEKPQIIFNMSVGYDLEGIKTRKVDSFINNLKNASQEPFFLECKKILLQKIQEDQITSIKKKRIEEITPEISNSITLSTMHGCPPAEQEAICKYLIKEKDLHTFVKLNPTLLGYDLTVDIFRKMKFSDIELDKKSFDNDLQYQDAISMIRDLQKFAKKYNRQFGVKLSNTLPVRNSRGILPGKEMYMSGKSLFPLTINLANKISGEFAGKLPISYSGGANFFNIRNIFQTGIFPITFATDLLKPGGNARLTQMNELIEDEIDKIPSPIDLEKLNNLSENVTSDKKFKRREFSFGQDDFAPERLPIFDCASAPCSSRCPIDQDVPAYIKNIEEGKFERALQIILDKNPLPFITGYICDHKCQLDCTRNYYEDPVLIRDLKRIAAENGFDKLIGKIVSPAKRVGEKAAIIGAGPAGLSAGFFLAKAGFDVTIFEKEKRAGGTVEYVIPNFRLPESAIENDIGIIKKIGVNFELNADADFSIEKLKRSGFKYIFIGIGAGKSRKIAISGEKGKTLAAIDFLKDFKNNTAELGERVALIGGGNSAMDAARAASRLENTKKVFLLYRRTKKYMPADYEEFEAAIQEGVIFQELVSPVSYNNGILKCQKMRLGDAGADGRRKPVARENEFVEFPVDNIVSAIGEEVEHDLLEQNGIVIDPAHMETNIENVFIGGDALHGPSTVVEAIADGRKVADEIIGKTNLPDREQISSPVKIDNLDAIGKKKGIIQPSLDSLQCHSEIEAESFRCLECNLVCNRCLEVCPNRANIAIRIKDEKFRNPYQIIHIEGMCNECGNCETFCPLDGKPYKDKFTIFENEKEFKDSENDGVILSSRSFFTTKLRTKSKVYEVNIKEKVLMNSAENIPEFERISKLIRKILEDYSYLVSSGR